MGGWEGGMGKNKGVVTDHKNIKKKCNLKATLFYLVSKGKKKPAR